MDILSGLAIGVLVTGASIHHTTNHAPAGGYNENHSVIGLEVEQNKAGFLMGLSGAFFKDSFDKPSNWLFVTGEYAKDFGGFRVAPGIGVGYLRTSYYDGVGVMPYVEAEYKMGSYSIYGKVSHAPKVADNMDAVTMGTAGLKVRF